MSKKQRDETFELLEMYRAFSADLEKKIKILVAENQFLDEENEHLAEQLELYVEASDYDNVEVTLH